MYQVIMYIYGQTINGKVYNTLAEVSDALHELRKTAQENDFPATYRFKEL